MKTSWFNQQITDKQEIERKTNHPFPVKPINLSKEMDQLGADSSQESFEVTSMVLSDSINQTQKSYHHEEIDQFKVEASEASFKDTSMVLSDWINKTKTNVEELDETINAMMESLGQGELRCKVCGKIETKFKKNMRNHIEAKHIEGVSHPCSQCGKIFRSRESIRLHVFKFHKI